MEFKVRRLSKNEFEALLMNATASICTMLNHMPEEEYDQFWVDFIAYVKETFTAYRATVNAALEAKRDLQ